MVRVAVPLAGNTLSGPLSVIALVSRYLTNKLIVRAPLPFLRKFSHHDLRRDDPSMFTLPFDRLSPGWGCV